MRNAQFTIPLLVLGVLLAAGCTKKPGEKPAAPLFEVTTTSLPAGTVGEAYSAELSAKDGTTPYTWKISEGTLPKGLVLSASGKITGTPTEGAEPSLTLQVADGSTPQKTATRVLSLTIEPETLAVTTEGLPDGKVDRYYGEELAARGGVPPYTWTASTLPEGLKFRSRGYLAGTPKTDGRTEITFTVTDARNKAAKGSISLLIKRGMSEALVKKVYWGAFNEQFEAMKAGKTLDANQSFNDAAKAEGFKDYRDFCEQGAKWNASKFGVALTEVTKAYTKKVRKWSEERAKRGAEGK